MTQFELVLSSKDVLSLKGLLARVDTQSLTTREFEFFKRLAAQLSEE